MGAYLRTNYRRLTGQINIDGIGGGLPKASITGGAGTTDPYGGFMFLSVCAPIHSAQLGTASMDGLSSRVVLSTYELMASYYGAGAFTSGYAFLPIVAYTMSLMSGAAFYTHSYGGYEDSFYMPITVSFRRSGSYAIFTPLYCAAAAGAGGNSLHSLISLSYCSGSWQIGGFIVSGP